MTEVAVTPQAQTLKEFFSRLAEATNKSELSHGLHPYPAKFIPHIPRRLIEEFSDPGDTVWDPMVGSGTTLVEAAALGRPAIGTDLNPIATLVSSAKTTLLDDDGRSELERLALSVTSLALELQRGVQGADRRLPEDDELPDFPNRDHWFARQTSRELAYLMRLLTGLDSAQARLISRCAVSAVIVALSFQESETRWCAKRRDVAAGEALMRFAGKLTRSLAALNAYASTRPAGVEVLTVDAREVPLPDASVDLVVTSPPYANSHDYYLYNKLRMFWLGYDVAPVQIGEIGSRNRHSDKKEPIETYLSAMTDVMAEARRCLRDGGRAIFVVSDAVIRGEFFRMDDAFARIGEVAGLDVESVISFDHRPFNTAFQRSFGTKHRKETRVVVFAA